jgi:hypothetical protein
MPYKDIKKQKAAERRYKQNKLDWISALKIKRGCDKCGYRKHPAALQFHHKDAETKVRTISEMAGRNYSKEDILKEIRKCDLFCANCHAVHHATK